LLAAGSLGAFVHEYEGFCTAFEEEYTAKLHAAMSMNLTLLLRCLCLLSPLQTAQAHLSTSTGFCVQTCCI
jgi:hypothetical protein